MLVRTVATGAVPLKLNDRLVIGVMRASVTSTTVASACRS